MVDIIIREYYDHFSQWWGLRDGTLLSTDDPQGMHWVKVDGKTMLVEEFNRWHAIRSRS